MYFKRLANIFQKIFPSNNVMIFVTHSILKMNSSKDPLHGKTLANILSELRAYYEWEDLAREIDINCFKNDPSINSSLKFLRKTEWARKKVENLYVSMINKKVT